MKKNQVNGLQENIASEKQIMKLQMYENVANEKYNGMNDIACQLSQLVKKFKECSYASLINSRNLEMIRNSLLRFL